MTLLGFEPPRIVGTRPYFRPGDVIGFSGNSWEGAVINLCTFGVPYWGLSHVGIVAEYRGRVLMFESTSLNDQPCAIAGKRVSGVQAHWIDDAVANYDGKVWHYPLYRWLYEHERIRLKQHLLDQIGRPYDKAGALRSGGFVFSAIEAAFRNQDTSELFCSETVAAAISAVGIVPIANASRWNPNRLVRRLRRDGILLPPVRLK